MLSQPSEFKYIVIDDQGTAFIAETRFKVRMLAAEHVFHGWTPFELKWQHPHLTLAQIHAALAYYYDHQEAMDAEIREGEEFAERMRAEHPNPFTRAELEARRSQKSQ